MDVSSCVLEVNVNGEEIFIVDKDIISSYCGKIRNLFGNSMTGTKIFKVIFQDFPGRADGFELMTRFCYNHGNIEINPLNILTLYCIAHFMEMDNSVFSTCTLVEQTERCLEEIKYWSWSELLVALKQCQDLPPFENSLNILQKCVDCLVTKLSLAGETSPCSSIFSPDSSSIRLSCDTRSTVSLKSTSFQGTWWFGDLVALNPSLVELVVQLMVCRKFDHSVITRFLVHYQSLRIIHAKLDEKRQIIEMVINLFCLLNGDAFFYKSLFRILRVALNVSISEGCRRKLETMIGTQMDLATLDNLLVPSPNGTTYLYDVNLVIRILKAFLEKGTSHVSLVKLKKVAILMDLYIAEVAPDPCLKPLKFLALVRSLPDHARDTYDSIYRAMDIYFQVHTGLSEEDKIRVCGGLNYEKLSLESTDNLVNNKNFPSNLGIQALVSRRCMMKCFLEETSKAKSSVEMPCTSLHIDREKRRDGKCNQIVVNCGKLSISTESEKLRDHIQGMQCRVLELEKVCKKMQNQMTKMMKSRVSSQTGSSRSLPRLCS